MSPVEVGGVFDNVTVKAGGVIVIVVAVPRQPAPAVVNRINSTAPGINIFGMANLSVLIFVPLFRPSFFGFFVLFIWE